MEETKFSVLIVDDDKNNRNILQMYLSKAGYLVLTAKDAENALEILEMVVPDAILMDYQMPRLNGLDALKDIRSVNKRTAVLIMTAYSSQEVAIDAIRSQADDFLPKPLNFREIPSLVKSHILQRRKLFPPIDYNRKPIKENLFTHFLLMKESIPIYSLGRWAKFERQQKVEVITEHSNEDETLISGFISAIQSFSNTIFGENLGELSMGTHQLLIRTHGDYLVCLTVQTDTYRWLLKYGLISIINDTLNDILFNVTLYLTDSFGYKEGISFIRGYINSTLKQTALKIATMG